MIVVDASALIEWLLRLPHAQTIDAAFADPSETLHAPHLVSVEVAQVIRRYERRGDIDASRAVEALGDLADLDLMRHEHEPLLPMMWLLRPNLTAYDAAYVALARVLDAPLLTLDSMLAAAPHGAEVRLIR